MTLRLTPEQLAAYNAKRGGYAPAETTAPLPADRAVLLHRPPAAPAAFICTIPGTPVAKGRPRFDKAGHAYTPEKTRAAEAAIRSVVALAGAMPFPGAVRLELDFFLPIPARMPRERAAMALQGAIRPTGKPDATNLAKLAEDAIQGHGPGYCFADDGQVAELVLRKWYAEEPRTVLRVTPL